LRKSGLRLIHLQETKMITRRQALRLIAGGIAASFLPGDALKRVPDRWSFLEKAADFQDDYHTKALDYFQVKESYVKLGPKMRIHPHSPNLQFLKQKFDEKIDQELRQKNLRPDHFKVAVENLYYGVPAQRKFYEPLMEYCKQAVDFLHHRISGLEIPGIDCARSSHQNH